ncbi:hypothetical protein L7F22_040993 [Adiantum nelumboides]|nr:hypothetical protein [Adiantum nelumboides]
MAEVGTVATEGTIVAFEHPQVLYLDDYPSYGGTPSYGVTPKPTPVRNSSATTSHWGASTDGLSDDTSSQRSPSFLLRSVRNLILNGIVHTQHENALQGNGDSRGGCGNGDGGHNVVDMDVAAHMPYFARVPETETCSDVMAARAICSAEEEEEEEETEGFIELESGHDLKKKPALGTSSKPPLRVDLKFENVKYEVISQKSTKWRGKMVLQKQILHGLTGSVACGEMLAMMGPSGSGKTTFLRLLGGRRCSNSSICGSIQYNQLPFTKNLKRRMGFVTQDDVLFPHLTVRETLRFAALLRLARDLKKGEKVERVEEVIRQLGLQQCANTMVGNQFLGGVSGGERKRVCIGQEILVNPSLLFLDEPTSGLDSTTALRLIKILQHFAQEGRTVVTTIHQPSSRVFYMFDKLLLLSEGHGIYFGKANEATSYFASLGFSPFVPMNPADFLLDLCSCNITDMSMPECLKESISTPIAGDAKKYLVDCYQKQTASIEKFSKTNGGGGQGGRGNFAVMSKDEAMGETRMWETTWWEQFVILWIRGTKERRHEYLSSLRVIQVLVSAFIAGCLWWKSKHYTPQQLQDQAGLFFFIAIFWGYLPLFSAIFTFPLERAMLVKERSSDMYRLSAYFMARTLGDLPLDLALPLLFMVILYFMTNLEQTFKSFILTLLTTFLIVLTSQGFGLLIGAAMMDVQKATTFASIAILVFMLVGGFFVKYIPPFIAWIKYFSFQAYTFNILIQIQYRNHAATLDCKNPPGCQSPAVGAFEDTPFHDATKSALALLIMVFGYRLLAYIALRCMRYGA